MEQISIDAFLGDLLKQNPTKKPKAKKQAVSIVTSETRRESHQQTDKRKLKAEVIRCLRRYGAQTAREIAVRMCAEGFIPYPARAVIQPRLTELVQEDLIVVVGKTYDETTGRKVAVYKVV